MRVFLYQAALFCPPCGTFLRKRLECVAPADIGDESSYDSDSFPKGPYSHGGGYADTPQYCDACHIFLENPLTPDGFGYVQERLDSERPNAVLAAWAEFYGMGPKPIDPDASSQNARTVDEWRAAYS